MSVSIPHCNSQGDVCDGRVLMRIWVSPELPHVGGHLGRDGAILSPANTFVPANGCLASSFLLYSSFQHLILILDKKVSTFVCLSVFVALCLSCCSLPAGLSS